MESIEWSLGLDSARGRWIEDLLLQEQGGGGAVLTQNLNTKFYTMNMKIKVKP